VLIDWFTVGAQVANFVLLVWLMKHFLFQPILKAVDAREAEVAGHMKAAEAQQAEAQAAHADFDRRTAELEAQRAALLSTARDEAAAERTRLLTAAREAAEAKATQRAQAERTEAAQLVSSLQQRTQAEVLAIARRALTDLAATSLEERMVAVVLDRLAQLDAPTRARLTQAFQAEAVRVRSAFDLADEQRAALQYALNVALSADVKLVFETAPAFISGIELMAGGQKVAWSLAGYLDGLQRLLDVPAAAPRAA